MSLSGLGHRIAVASLVGIAVIFGAGLAPASASPLAGKQRDAARARARIATSNAAVQEAVRGFEAARERLAAIEATAAANSAMLDRLVVRQRLLQTRLGLRAVGMYRVGPLGYVEILARSTSFEQLSTRWDQLTRLVRQEALMIRELKSTKAQVARTAEDLLKQQAEASAQLRVMEAARAKARSELSRDRAAVIAFEREIAALEAKRAAERAAVVKVAAKSEPRPQPHPTTPATGSGTWSSAVASCYGPGFYGKRTASGEIVQPDSMIVAHKTMRFGTVIEFAYRGRTAVARVADRGPFVGGREFDLGPGTARVLGFGGVGTVQYRVISR